MTFEKFKEEFEACERIQKYSTEFNEVLEEVLKSFQVKSFISDENNHFLGESTEDILFGYKSEVNLFLVDEAIFYNTLKKIDANERILFLAFCFCKYWSVDFDETNINALVLNQSEIQGFLKTEGELHHIDDEYFDTKTGLVFKKNDFKIEAEFIPHVFTEINCNSEFKNAAKL